MKRTRLMSTLIASGVLSMSVGGTALAAPCRANPCSPRNSRMNPCAARNPCAAKNPCATKNPCAAAMADRVDTGLVLRPKNYRPYRGNENDLVSFGKNLFSDTGLSTNGMSCNTCHQDHASFQDTFAKPYPHFVQMTHDRAGVEAVHLDEMIQFCMVVPMAAKPLPWDSRELAALTAYTSTLQKSFKPGMAGTNPCAAKNPCAARSANPCAMNPCTAKRKNPCATKNPCAGRNPCGAH